MTKGYVGGSYLPNKPQYMVDNRYKYWAGGGAFAGTILGVAINAGVFGSTTVTLSTFAGYVNGAGAVSWGSLTAGTTSFTALGVIAAYVLPALIFAAIVYMLLPQQKLFIETPKYFRRRFSNKPFLNNSNSVIKKYDNLTGVISGYYSDGGYIYYVPAGPVFGPPTTRKLSYKYYNGIKTFTQIDILNDTTKQEYIVAHL